MLSIILQSVGECLHRPSSFFLDPLFLPFFNKISVGPDSLPACALETVTKFANIKDRNLFYLLNPGSTVVSSQAILWETWQIGPTKLQGFCCRRVMVSSQFRTGIHWGAVGDGEKGFCDQVVEDLKARMWGLCFINSSTCHLKTTCLGCPQSLEKKYPFRILPQTLVQILRGRALKSAF